MAKGAHLQQHAEHDFALGVELAHRVGARDDFAKVGPLAEEVDRDRNQSRGNEELHGLAAGVEAFAKLENSGHVDDRPGY